MYNAWFYLWDWGKARVRTMPIYEYHCEACGHKQEALQKISDEPLTECSACQQPTLKKIISASGFRLSGSGWYETDFKGSKKKNLSSDSNSDS
jgi:putative FmdB family regulatory protein